MRLSDNVIVALISSISTTVVSIATLVATVLTRRKVGKLDTTVRSQHAITREHIGAAADGPGDVPTRPESRTESRNSRNGDAQRDR